MKDIILLSESILTEHQIPTDLLDPTRFDLRTIVASSEIIILAKTQPPKAIVVDLKDLGVEPQAFIQELREVHQETLIPVMAAISKEEEKNAIQFFSAGFNALLTKPIDSQTLGDALQSLMGLKFRKFERKPLETPVSLSHQESTWNVVAKMVNRECLLVTGEDLPPQGMNVFVTSKSVDALSLYNWSFCWRRVKDGVVLRFLNPSEELLNKIDQLPSFNLPENKEPSPNAPTPQKTPNKSIPEILDNPYQLMEISLEENLPLVRQWAQEKDKSPFPWPKIFADLNPAEEKLLLHPPAEFPNISEIILLKILLENQLKGLKSSFVSSKDFNFSLGQKVLESHERIIAKANESIKKSMVQFLQAKNEVMVSELNQLRSALQKSLITMQKTLTMRGGIQSTSNAKGEPAPSTRRTRGPRSKGKPKKEKKSATKIGSILEKVFLFAAILSLFAGAGIYTYFKISAPQRHISMLSPQKVQALSTYFEVVQQYKAKDKIQFTVTLKSNWNDLADDEKKRELNSIAEKFNLLKLEMAKLRLSKGPMVAIFLNGKFKVLSSHKPKKP